MYVRDWRGVPPGVMLESFMGAEGLGRGEPGEMGRVVVAVEEGKKDSLKGWLAIGVEEERAGGAGFGLPGLVEGGGVDGAAFLVCGTVAIVRVRVVERVVGIGEVVDVRLLMRWRSVRRQDMHSIAAV